MGPYGTSVRKRGGRGEAKVIGKGIKRRNEKRKKKKNGRKNTETAETKTQGKERNFIKKNMYICLVSFLPVLWLDSLHSPCAWSTI
jgi:hypothetical protein